MNKIFLVTFIVLCCFSGIKAQTSFSQIIPVKTTTYLDSVYDRLGKSYSIKELSLNTRVRNAARANRLGSQTTVQKSTRPDAVVSSITSGYFTVYFEIGSGMDDMDPKNTIQTGRREVLKRVLNDISNFIISPYTNMYDPNDQVHKVRILVTDPFLPNSPSISAAYATPFYMVPNVSDNIKIRGSILDNLAWQFINGGKDPLDAQYTFLSTYPSGEKYFHMLASFNFNNIFNLDLKINNPSSGTDLYKVMLHEFTHALGFASYAWGDGSSLIKNDCYTRYDKFIQNLNTTNPLNKNPSVANLITSNDPCDMYNYSGNGPQNYFHALLAGFGQAGSLGCDRDFKFVSDNIPSGTALLVGDPFKIGTSLSHLDYCQGDNIMSEYGDLIKMRNYSPIERQILCSLGYNVSTSFCADPNNPSQPEPDPNDPNKGPIVIDAFHDYSLDQGYTDCNKDRVVGYNDGISNGVYTIIAKPRPNADLQVSPLGNDINADQLIGLEIIDGNDLNNSATAVDNGDGTFTFTAPAGSEGNVYLLRYVPLNSDNGEEGNITYIVIKVDGDCNDNCNMVKNANFEMGATCTNISSVNNTTTLIPGKSSCWFSVNQYPEIFVNGCNTNDFNIPSTKSTPSTSDWNTEWNIAKGTNSVFIGLEGTKHSKVSNTYIQSIQTYLQQPLQANKTYRLNFWAKLIKGTNGGTINIGYSNSILLEQASNSFDPQTSLPYFVNSITNVSIAAHPNSTGNNQWYPYSVLLTTTEDAPNLVITNGVIFDHAITPYTSEILLDNIQILPEDQLLKLTLPASICVNNSINLLDYLSSNSASIGTFSVNGATIMPTNSTYLFSPTTQGSYLVQYTYTNANNCIVTVYGAIEVTDAPVIQASAYTTCSSVNSKSIVLNVSGVPGASYTWTPSNLVSCTTGDCSNASITPTTTQQVSVSVPGCINSSSITITVQDPVAPIINNTELNYCKDDGIGMPIDTDLDINYSGMLSWYDPYNNISLIAPNPPIDVAGDFVYYVSQNINGCESDKTKITVHVNEVKLNINIAGNQPICASQTGGSAVITVSGATDYIWTSFCFGSNTIKGSVVSQLFYVDIPFPTGLYNAQYKLWATDNRINCSTVQLVDVGVAFTAPPSISPSTHFYYCANQTAIPFDAPASPNGSLIWTLPNGSKTAVTPIADTKNAGTYTYKVTETENKCESESTSVIVDVADCKKTCGVTDGVNVIDKDISGQTYIGQKYYIGNDITMSGNMNFNNCEIEVKPGTTIYMSACKLTIAGSHFYSCNEMWKGIKPKDDAECSIKIVDFVNTKNETISSLIEDAEIAIDWTFTKDNTKKYNRSNQLLYIDGATFNRNNIAVKITGFKSTDPSDYPFTFVNNLFTCRSLPFTPGALSWLNSNTIRASSYTLMSGTDFTPPFLGSTYINNVFLYKDDEMAFLKIPYLNQKPSAGIVLQNVGYTDLPSNIFYGIYIGNNKYTEGVHYANIFDNLNSGIIANDANLNCSNNIFQNPYLVPAMEVANMTGFGINATASPDKYYKIKLFKDPNTNVKNTFYDESVAVRAVNYYKHEIDYCEVRSSLNSTVIGFKEKSLNAAGKYGFQIASNNFDNSYINNNNIYNIENPIVLNASLNFDWASSNTYYGLFNVDYNTIAPQLPNDQVTTQYVHKAITLAGMNRMKANKKLITCNYNDITGVYRGILFSNWIGKNTQANNNKVRIKSDYYTYINGSKTSSAQYGIRMESGVAANSIGNQIINNYMIGDYMSTLKGNTSNIEVYANSNTIVNCNEVKNASNGLSFFGTSTPLQCKGNLIYDDNQFGFSLNTAIIGKQGATNSWMGDYPTFNAWMGNWTNGNYKTALTNSDANLSKMVVASSNPQDDPTGSGTVLGQSYSGPYDYSNGTVIWANRIAPFADPCRIVKSVDLSDLPILIIKGRAAENIIDSELLIKVMQEQLYQTLKSDTTLTELSDTLKQFVEDNQSGNAFIYQIDSLLAEQDILGAYFKLGEWGVATNTHDANYQEYYNWIFKQFLGGLDSTDKAAIYQRATGCPITDGMVVFAARNLYNALNKENVYFEDHCPANTGARKINTKPIKPLNTKEVSENIIVFPNPTKGNITIQFTNNEMGSHVIKITDVYGKIVAEKFVSESSNNIGMNIKGSSGLYFITINNERTGKQTIKKLILQ